MTDEPKPKAKRRKWGDPGSRVVRRTTVAVFSMGKRRPVIVAVYPDGRIGLRLTKQQREEFVFADDTYREAVIRRKANERATRKKGKK